MKQGQSNKVAIVTGGGSGIGLAITEKFIQHNITTIIIGRNQDRLDVARERLGCRCIPLAWDLTNLETLPSLVKEITAQQGRIDILVNNAGVNMKKELLEVTDEDFQEVLLTNLVSVFALSREVAKVMIDRGGGSIVNISSMAALYGIPKVVAYSASKAAVDGMTRAMAVDLSPKGIKVNSVAPGFIATDMSARALDNDAERKQKVLSRTPLGFLGSADDVAEAVWFLASDAARYMTGVVLPVDGGNSIGF